MLSDDKQPEILERFIIDNSELDKLESLISEFNIFEAVGITRQEIRHSSFLAFLLNPSESHRLGDIFLKKFLVGILQSSINPPVKAIEIDLANWQDVEIRRELNSNNWSCIYRKKILKNLNYNDNEEWDVLQEKIKSF